MNRNDDVLNKLMSDVTTALDTYYGESDPTKYVDRYAEQVTSFDAWSNGKIENQAVRDHLMSFLGQIPAVDYEIVNPSVDVYGDVAVFAFNTDLTDRDTGRRFALWNTTEVLRHTDVGWQLVHTHWSFAIPPAEAEG